MATKKKETSSIVAFKAFDKNMQCRGYQYEVGKTYDHDGTVEACKSGFHSCENPLDILRYYDLCDSRFARITASGEVVRHVSDPKIASAKITIDAELKLPEFISESVKYLLTLCKGKKINRYSSQLAASGDYSQLAASGDSSKLAASGDYSKLAASGDSSIVVAAAPYCTAKIGKNGTIVLTRWVESENRYRITVGYEGENGIKADVWYKLDDNGVLIESAQ
jgi:hypothetical protein